MRFIPLLALPLLAACATGPGSRIATYQPAAGSNEVLRGAVTAAPGHELVVGDLVLGAGAVIPAHYHHGEEFLYVIGGSAAVSGLGMAAVTLGPGEGLRIPPGTVHSGRAGPDGVRAIASWVAVDGKPLRVPVPE